jgi:hypothetical protein
LQRRGSNPAASYRVSLLRFLQQMSTAGLHRRFMKQMFTAVPTRVSDCSTTPRYAGPGPVLRYDWVSRWRRPDCIHWAPVPVCRSRYRGLYSRFVQQVATAGFQEAPTLLRACVAVTRSCAGATRPALTTLTLRADADSEAGPLRAGPTCSLEERLVLGARVRCGACSWAHVPLSGCGGMRGEAAGHRLCG